MEKFLFTVLLVSFMTSSNAQNSFPTNGDSYINSGIPSGHGGGYNALWMPNATALMPENNSTYSGISLTANVIRNSSTNVWSFANSTLPAWQLYIGNGANTDYFNISRSSSTTYSPQSLLFINNIGNVLVGKTTQVNTGYKLDVNGNVRANQVVINSTGADFVFAPTYRLNSLENLKKYIDKNHHLPEIASAKEMETNGLNVGENQTKLLQKVEELTLYLIEKDKQIKDDEQRQKNQEDRIKSLEEKLNKLIERSN